MKSDDRSLATRARQFVLTLCVVVCALGIGMALNPEFGNPAYFVLASAVSGITGAVIGFRMIMRGE